jgi:hypothetical protein
MLQQAGKKRGALGLQFDPPSRLGEAAGARFEGEGSESDRDFVQGWRQYTVPGAGNVSKSRVFTSR